MDDWGEEETTSAPPPPPPSSASSAGDWVGSNGGSNDWASSNGSSSWGGGGGGGGAPGGADRRSMGGTPGRPQSSRPRLQVASMLTIDNLPLDVQCAEIRSMFGRFGKVTRIVFDYSIECDRVFCYLDFQKQEMAEAAIKINNGKKVRNRTIKVETNTGSGDSGDRPPRQKGCFNCGDENHMSRECPTKSSGGGGGGGNRPLKCFKCNEEGHRSHECTQSGGGGGGGRMSSDRGRGGGRYQPYEPRGGGRGGRDSHVGASEDWNSTSWGGGGGSTNSNGRGGGGGSAGGSFDWGDMGSTKPKSEPTSDWESKPPPPPPPPADDDGWN